MTLFDDDMTLFASPVESRSPIESASQIESAPIESAPVDEPVEPVEDVDGPVEAVREPAREPAAEPATAPAPPCVRVRMTIAYAGGGFHGFADNPGVRTVAGVVNEALSTVLRLPVRLTCAGRTDAGVHGWGQVISFDAPEDGLDVAVLQRKLNRMIGPEIVVRAAGVAPQAFSARHSALARRYRYSVLNRPLPDPFLAATTWHVPEPLDLAAMRLAADPLIGEHDFTSFGRIPKGVPDASMVRTVYEARWLDLGDGLLRFDIGASSFAQQMVRSLVGFLVDVGRGKRRAGEVLDVLRAKDRARAASIAPPQGLCLWEVVYPPDDAL